MAPGWFAKLRFKLRGPQELRADRIAAALKDGVFCVQRNHLDHLRIDYSNPVAKRILELQPELEPQVLRLARTLDASAEEVPISIHDPESQTTAYFILSRIDSLSSRESIIMARNVTRSRESEMAKNHFLGLLSHEIRTPVTSLVMAIGLLERAADQFSNPVHEKLIRSASRDVDRLRELIEDLLSISRFRSGTPSIVRRRVDLRKILRGTFESFKYEADQRDLRMSVRIDGNDSPQDWICDVDPSKLGWALSILLQNAVRQSPKGAKVSVSLHRSRSSDGRPYFEFRVHDSGSCLSGSRVGQIMEPYSGQYELRIGRTEATGSGMSVVRQIAEAHGGSLRVCFSADSGSQFQLRFPSQERRFNGQVAGSG
jgi:K+-sensing histidine kinase KdpD